MHAPPLVQEDLYSERQWRCGPGPYGGSRTQCVLLGTSRAPRVRFRAMTAPSWKISLPQTHAVRRARPRRPGTVRAAGYGPNPVGGRARQARSLVTAHRGPSGSRQTHRSGPVPASGAGSQVPTSRWPSRLGTQVSGPGRSTGARLARQMHSQAYTCSRWRSRSPAATWHAARQQAVKWAGMVRGPVVMITSVGGWAAAREEGGLSSRPESAARPRGNRGRAAGRRDGAPRRGWVWAAC